MSAPRTRLLPALAFLAIACGAPATPRSFHFDSGGEHHFEGFGAWSVDLGPGGAVAIAHRVGGARVGAWECPLEPARADRLWRLIDAAEFAGLRLPDRPAAPDEIRMTFRLRQGSRLLAGLTPWAADATAEPRLAALLSALRELIEDRTGEKPVF